MRKIAAAIAAFACATLSAQVYLDSNADIESRVEDALGRMTLHEKVSLLHAQSKFTSAGVPRLGIRQLNMSDGPHGCRAEVDWNSWNNAGWTNDSIVAFPSLTCLAATWNPELSRVYGHNVSEEFAFRGKDILLGPGTTIARVPLCGRNFEYMGEDPYLAGTMAVPYVQAAQANGVACCLKHFFLNNQEVDRFTVNVNVSERALQEIYLPAFKRVVQEGGLWTIMGSYNLWENVHCCQHDHLLNKILKQEWGFDGAVISDWGGVNDTWQAATGGLDLEMGSFTNGKTMDFSFGYHTYNLADPFEKLLRDGKISEEVLNDKARRVLRTIFRTSMNPRKVVGSQCSEAHYEACRLIGEEGIVLMKNDLNILPIDAAYMGRILVVGENGTRNLCEGGGSSELKTLRDISPLDGLRAVFGDRVAYAQGYASGLPKYGQVDEVDPALQQRLHDEAVAMAKDAGLIVYIGGMNKNYHEDCEDGDRLDYHLSFGQDQLIADLAAVCPDMVVVTFGGNPFAMPWIDKVKAMLHCWYLGSMSGETLARVITGAVNPSGHLPVTFAVNQDDYPCFQWGEEGYPGVDKQVYYKEDVLVGYRWFNTKRLKPLFPFGHGLSYTTFAYGKADISHKEITADGTLDISVDVTNTGSRDGKEVVQLYIGDEKCSIERPAKELRSYKKISLRPHETQTVTFTVSRNDLQFYDPTKGAWVVEPGRFKAYVGSSESDIRATVTFRVTEN